MPNGRTSSAIDTADFISDYRSFNGLADQGPFASGRLPQALDAMNGFYPECISANGYDRVSPLEESTSMASGLFEGSKEANDQF